MNNQVSYKMWSLDVVEIKDGFREPMRYNKEGLEITIANIKKQRDSYRTFEAFQTNLAIYENALYFLIRNMK